MSIVEDAHKPLDPKLVRRAAYGVVLAGVVAALVGEFMPGEVPAVIGISGAVAPVLLALLAPQLFEVTSKTGQRGINPVFIVPSLIVFFAGWLVDLIDIGTPWLAAGVGAAVGAAAGLISAQRRTIGGPVQLMLYLAVSGLFLGPGSLMLTNWRFDHVPATPFRAVVMEKQVTHGKSTSYSLMLSAWGPRTDEDWVNVPSPTYDAIQAGDQACLLLHPGFLHIRWFTVDACNSGKAG